MTESATKPPAIQIDNLCVYFKTARAVDNLNMRVEEGDIFGFIGPNGAGKTTTIKVLVTLLRSTRGVARVFGHDVRYEGDAVRKIVGYMPDEPAAYGHMYVHEYLEFFAAAHNIPQHKHQQIVNDVLELTDLGSKRDTPVGELSRGMQQRVSLARVLVHNPKVLILDEPASGLDPRARIEVMEILRELAAMGKTILISSHILSELRAICNRVGIIEQGALVFSGGVDELLRRTAGGRRVLVALSTPADAAAALFDGRPEVLEAAHNDGVLTLSLADEVDDLSFIADTLVAAGHRVQTIREEEAQLEDAFMKITKGLVS